jgi:hypothetical protein
MRHPWWRRNGPALAAAPFALGAAFWVAGRPLIDIWTIDEPAPRTVQIKEPFGWDGDMFELTAIEPAPHPIDDDGRPFESPPGTVVWRTAWEGRGSDEQTGLGCIVEIVDGDGRRFGADPTELTRLGGGSGCTPGFGADPASYRFVRFFLLPADAEPVTVRFSGFDTDTDVVAITLN